MTLIPEVHVSYFSHYLPRTITILISKTVDFPVFEPYKNVVIIYAPLCLFYYDQNLICIYIVTQSYSLFPLLYTHSFVLCKYMTYLNLFLLMNFWLLWILNTEYWILLYFWSTNGCISLEFIIWSTITRSQGPSWTLSHPFLKVISSSFHALCSWAQLSYFLLQVNILRHCSLIILFNLFLFPISVQT